MTFVQSFCVLDAGHRFLYVGGDWDAFAQDNGAEAATGEAIAGSTLFDHIEGFETRAFLNAALFAVRDCGKPFVLDYRCDSPRVRRFMRMTVSPLRGDRLLMLHDFLHEERVGKTLLPWIVAQDGVAPKCSVCCAVQYGEVWLDPFLARNPHPARVQAGLCPSCRALTAGRIAEMERRTELQKDNVIRLPRRA
ncbi:MAG: hypothetical protein RLZZ528_2435 [Pseudomonadota bacterium]|jgi:hypothetical protein